MSPLLDDVTEKEKKNTVLEFKPCRGSLSRAWNNRKINNDKAPKSVTEPTFSQSQPELLGFLHTHLPMPIVQTPIATQTTPDLGQNDEVAFGGLPSVTPRTPVTMLLFYFFDIQARTPHFTLTCHPCCFSATERPSLSMIISWQSREG